MTRPGAFLAVGAVGFAVQVAAFAALTRLLGVPYVPASALAVELAVLNNFLWHERWTWKDRPAAGWRTRARRLAGFHAANGVISIGGTVLFTVAFVEGAGWTPLGANLAALAATGIINYLASDRLVFRTDTPCDSNTTRAIAGAPPGCSCSR